MIRRARLVVVATAVSLLYALACASTALADARFARKLGEEVGGLGKALLLAVAGLCALPVIARRDVNGGVVLLILVALLGAFVYAPDQIVRVVTDLWKSLSA